MWSSPVIRRGSLGWNTKSHATRGGWRGRRGFRLWGLEGLEDRVLLSATLDTVTDTSDSDSDTGSLPYAVIQANNNTNPAGSVIEFDPNVFNGNTPKIILLTSTLSLTNTAGPELIHGNGPTTVQIDGQSTVQPFHVADGVTASIFGLTIQDGKSSGGGGILNEGNLTVNSTTIADCSAEGGTEYGGQGGGIFNGGTLDVLDSTISNNSGYTGGGIDNDGALTLTACTIASNSSTGDGGGIYNNGPLTVTDCTIASNTILGAMGGGIDNDTDGELHISDSTIADNEADKGGGIDNNNDSMTLANSTIANNSAITAGGGIFVSAPLTAVNCTIAFNTVINAVKAGGGLDVPSVSSSPTLDNTIVALNTDLGNANPLVRRRDDLDNTIVALNADLSGADDITGSVSPSSAYNLIGVGGSGGLTKSHGNQVDVANPGLTPLANNGGDTQTIGLAFGSPAFEAGSTGLAVDPTTKQPLSTDQRGAGFPRILVAGKVDIGALEQPLVRPHPPTFRLNRGHAGLLTLQTAPNGISLLPAGRKTDLPWIGINSFQFDFNEPVVLTAAAVTLQSARGINYRPVTVSSSGTTYNIKFAHPIAKADRVTITVNIAGAEVFAGRLNVLPGDVNGDGVVNSKDLTAIRKDLHGNGSAQSLIFGDLLDDGAANKGDLAAAKNLIGTKLPRLAVKHPKASLALALVRRHLDMKPHC